MCYFLSVCLWQQCFFNVSKLSIQIQSLLTHWDWVTHTHFGNLTITGSDNGLWPHQHQAIIWTKAGILITWPLGEKFSEILIEIHTFSYKLMHLKMLSVEWRLNVLMVNLTHKDWTQNQSQNTNYHSSDPLSILTYNGTVTSYGDMYLGQHWIR